MAEWSMAVVLKTTEPATVPGVRIPLPPPNQWVTSTRETAMPELPGSSPVRLRAAELMPRLGVPDIFGFPTGSIELTGGGAYAPGTQFAQSAGSFRCTTSISQGPLNGCASGEGVRWDTAGLLASTGFKCTGAAGEAGKTATT